MSIYTVQRPFNRKEARRLRENAGISLSDAAHNLGITQDLMRRYENGKGEFYPTIDLVQRMANMYKCRTNELT